MAACQKKQNSVIDTNSSSLIELKDQIKSVQAMNKVNYDTAMGIYNSTQAERREKLTSVQNGQAEIIEMLSSLKKNNDKVQERLEILESKTGATENFEVQDWATVNGEGQQIPPPVDEARKVGCLDPEIDAKKLVVTMDKVITEDTHFTTVLTSQIMAWTLTRSHSIFKRTK